MTKPVEITWQDEAFQLLPEKALFWEKEKTLFISDPHFGKAATFRKAGIPVTEKTTVDDVEKLSQIISKTKTKRIVFLGDFIHARSSKIQVLRNLLFLWREEFRSLDLHLIRGNHDHNAGDPWPELGIQCHDEPWNEFKWQCRHYPLDYSNIPYFAGHLHPGFSLRGKGRDRMRSACFQINDSRIIFPAFGSFTGLKDIQPEKDDQLFLTNGEEIIALPATHSFVRSK